ncbi:MAG: class I SAM-dependent methyltransferase [Actinomycetota bacterium]
MSGSVHEAAAEGFGAAAGEYERRRPLYPEAAVERLVAELEIGPGLRILDLGAGTGKLTRMLLPFGPHLIGVEPVASMREKFVEVLPDVPLAAGLAEALPLADGSFDAVICAQAFHWFDGDRALPEIHRVLRPGGRLALLWNVKDERFPWVKELGDILRPYQDAVPQESSGEWQAAFSRTNLFGPLTEARFPHSQRLDAPGLVERYASASYISFLPEAEGREVLERIRTLADSHPETSGREFDLPYATELHWTTRR